MDVFDKTKFLALLSLLCLIFPMAQVDAQVFLRGNDRTGAQSDNSSDTSRSNNSFLMLENRDRPDPSARHDYFKERVERSKRPQSAEAGQSYSIQEYNRLLSEQRRAAEQTRTGAATTNRSFSSGQQYYPSSYLNRGVERVRRNPFTRRLTTTAEIEKDVAAREAYYKQYPQLKPRDRGIVEERYFNEHGYYEEDKDLIVGKDGTLSQRTFGSRIELGNAKRATSRQYLDSAERFRNNER